MRSQQGYIVLPDHYIFVKLFDSAYHRHMHETQGLPSLQVHPINYSVNFEESLTLQEVSLESAFAGVLFRSTTPSIRGHLRITCRCICKPLIVITSYIYSTSHVITSPRPHLTQNYQRDDCHMKGKSKPIPPFMLCLIFCYDALHNRELEL